MAESKSEAASDPTQVTKPARVPDPWYVFRRVQEVESAWRVNIVRLTAIVCFYLVHLVNGIGSTGTDEKERTFNANVNLICGFWFLLAIVVFLAYYSHRLPPIAKYLSTIADVFLLTAIAHAGAKTESVVVVLFFVILATTVMRMSKNLVIVITANVAIAYLVLVGTTDRVWFDSQHDVPLIRVFVVETTIILMGVTCWLAIHGCENWIRRTSEGRHA